jgi:hypothetical protein
VPARRQARAYARALSTRGRGRAGSTFLIFAQGRTGSSLLVDLLNRSPSIHCDEEILARPVFLPTAWMAAHRARHLDRTYGFKVKLYQLTIDQGIGDPNRWLAAMHRSGWQVIYLWRRNLLRHVLSNVAASGSGRYHYRSAEIGGRRIRVDLAETIRLLRMREQLGQEERSALEGVPHEPLCYEDDLLEAERHQPTFDRIAGFLQMEPAHATTDLRRINAGPLSELIENYAELKRELAGTRWERYLD